MFDAHSVIDSMETDSGNGELVWIQSYPTNVLASVKLPNQNGIIRNA